jgi:hypothetical protein
MQRYLKFGSRTGRKTGWIALANKDRNTQIDGDFLIGKECQFLSEIEQEVEDIKAELEEVLAAARKRLGSSS